MNFLRNTLVKSAFTLAEVLIVLGIIGVIAELTVPALMMNTAKQEYVTSLKKAFSQFNQALSEISSDAGCVNDIVCSTLMDTNSTTQSIGVEISNRFKVIKNCDINPNSGCFSDNTSLNWDGSGTRVNTYATGGAYRFITADGIAFYIGNYHNNCGNNFSNNASGDLTQVCGVVYIDVNGPNKAPNNWGRDIFGFWIANGKGAHLYPMYGNDDGKYYYWKDKGWCSDTSKAGGPCVGRVIEEGWQMNY